MRASTSASSIASVIRMASAVGLTKVFSWRKRTVSPPTLVADPLAPMVTVRSGGSDAAESEALASSETCGHFANSVLP